MLILNRIRPNALAALFFLWFTVSGSLLHADGRQGYYRQPTIHGDVIAFVAEGDIWSVAASGGVARRLTTHPAAESYPHFSPDGKTLALAAQYEGPTEVYTMPLDGGPPQRRTVEAESSIPVGWTMGGKLVYRTRHYSTLPAEQLVEIDLANNGFRRIPLSQASDATWDAGGAIYFTRPRFHQQEVKRYKGGTARNIWKFSRDQGEAKNLTAEFAGEHHSPMWYSGRVYFVTDRDGNMNIWSMNASGEDLTQHTRHSGMDVRSADIDKDQIVYRVGADIWLLNISTGVHQIVPITLASDFDQLREKWVDDPMDQLTSAHLHPEGKSVVLTSRGRIFVAPSGQGRLVQASRAAGVRYRDACFMPDGQNLLTLSDESGEYEFWSISARGLGTPKQLTRDGDILRWRAIPAPDGKHFAYNDKNNDLWIVQLENGSRKLISQNRQGIGDITWSPDSRWIVFAQNAVNTYQQLMLYHLDDETIVPLTSNRVNSSSPAWSTDGNWLYFVSDRSLQSLVPSPWGPRQPEPYFDKPMKIYRLALKKGLRSPFQADDELYKPESNDDSSDDKPSDKENESNEASEKLQGKDDAEKSKTTEEIAKTQIDVEGIQHRVKDLPVPAGNIRDLFVNKDSIFWLERESGRNADTNLMGLKIGNKNNKPLRVVADIQSVELSDDKKKLLIRKSNNLYVVDAAVKSISDLTDKKIDLSNWQYSIDVREDLRQIFVDAWRLHRDYFYDPNMHGVNWLAVRKKYEPLVDRVTTRAELSDVIGQMVGELSVLHTSVRGGDHRRGDDQVTIPTLGAQLTRAENDGGYRINYIYQSDPDYPEELSPLADPDLNIQQGDVIESINGEPVLARVHPHLLLRNQAGRQVLLKIQSGESKESREVIVKPIANEAALRYRDWEYTRRMHVEEKAKGSVGYVHLQAMGGRNLTEWYRNFYPVFDRQGLIIDVRHNRGGNIDSIILEKLMRKAWFYWKARVGVPTWNMQYAFRGHMVVLCDEHTASDGEAFAEGFRRLELGKVIGTRTWGGEVWLTSSNRLSDGGIATAAEFGVYGPERIWLIEGHGVDPDIVVDNLPYATFNGSDAQLDAAIDHLLKKIEEDPRDVPKQPDYPDKSFDYR